MFVKENPDRKKLKKINSSHTFLLWYCFKGVLEAIHYAKVTVLISQHLLQASIIASSLSLIRKKLEILYLFEESNCSPAVIKVSIYSTSYCSNFCWQPPHSFMITAQKWSFLRIWSHLLKKALMEKFNFCAVGKRVQLTNLILLIRTCNDLQYFLWKFYILSSENSQGQGLRLKTFCDCGRRKE